MFLILVNYLPPCRDTSSSGPLGFTRRGVLAVPFVGKDVPSRASEWSHPDVLIGLGILAYRYEGLRMSDLENKQFKSMF